jgi:hypothetical protein
MVRDPQSHNASTSALDIRQVKRRRAVGAGPPDSEITDVRREPRAPPHEKEVKIPSITQAQECAHPMNRHSDQERQEVLSQEKDLHREDKIKEECRVRDAPAHRRTGDGHEKGVESEADVSRVHGNVLHPEHAADPGHDLRCAEDDGNPDDGSNRPPPGDAIRHRHNSKRHDENDRDRRRPREDVRLQRIGTRQEG